LVYHGAKRSKKPQELSQYDIVITSYSLVALEAPGIKQKASAKAKTNKKKEKMQRVGGPLFHVKWFRVVLDESQCIKNFTTRSAQACCKLKARRRFCLSGTPIQNNLNELFSIFRFLRVRPFNSRAVFRKLAQEAIKNHETNSAPLRELHSVMSAITLRRTKEKTLKQMLPKRTVVMNRIPFTSSERAFYEALERNAREEFIKYLRDNSVMENYRSKTRPSSIR